jgi:sporulation protein YlmC with PRC-barrel domain
MRKPLIILAAPLAITPAAAFAPQRRAEAQAVQLVVVDVKVVANGYRASKLTGSSVVNDKNERIGTIDDLVLGADGSGCSSPCLRSAAFWAWEGTWWQYPMIPAARIADSNVNWRGSE